MPTSGRASLLARPSAPPAGSARIEGDAVSSAVALPRRFASLVKIEHTVFALPFAYIGALLSVNEVPSAHDLLWITVAMVGARSLAMGLNRIVDAEIDARNPRTATRELPAGLISRAQAVVFCALAFALYLVACFQLQPIVRWLWPIPVVGFGLDLGWLYWIGVVVVAALLAYEHSLVRPNDLRRLDAAFFTVNGVISVAFLLFVLAEVAL